MAAFKRDRTAWLRLCGALFLVCLPVWSQQPKSPTPKPGSPIPKCAFLRTEVRRVAEQAQDYAETAPLANVNSPEDLAAANGTTADLAEYVATSEVFAAHRTLLLLDVAACDRNIRLSDPVRLSPVENARIAHIKRAAQRWLNLAGEGGSAEADPITAKINAVYEGETRSFYDPSISQFADPDVGKDYSDIPAIIAASPLDQATKDFYRSAVALIHYEEAGRLSNALKGVDKDEGLSYAYLLRKTLADRVAFDTAQRNQLANQKDNERSEQLMHYAIVGLAVLFLLGLFWIGTDRTRAKYRAFRLGLKRSPFWFGNAEWIFWEPGETVVLLEHKHLVPMRDTHGGYRTISAWKGQEYKGRISYKTQCTTWTSDPIITSDGLAINLGVGIWWRITDAGIYVSRIASDYHEGELHKDENLAEAAEFWIKKLAAGTLREEVNQLPAEKLISPYVQAYLQVRSGPEEGAVTRERPLPNFSEQLGKAQSKLSEKTVGYGIEIERLEVQELILPPIYQQKLEAVRVAFLEPTEATALTKAQVIALEGLSSVIGSEKVGLIEVLKHVDLSHLTMNPFTGMIPIVQPVVNALQQQTEKALPSLDNAPTVTSPSRQ
jgi:SPFH domain / Band 7 family